MIKFENFIMSFLGSEVPEEALIKKIDLDFKKEKIILTGQEIVDTTVIDMTWSIPFLTVLDPELLNDGDDKELIQ